MSWRHSGFSVHNDSRVARDDEEGKEVISQYIIRNTFSLEKLTYNEETNTVIYQSKMTSGKNKKNFQIYTPEELIVAITQHIPEKSFKWSVTMVGVQTSHADYARNRDFSSQENHRNKYLII